MQLTVSVIGCVTALLAASIALTQTDLKRVMAYSTVSQLGYMFMALGAGVKGVAEFAIIAGMFHLFTHAFFKALLFLSSGSVMHAMGGVIDMRQFSGLRHRLPYTHALSSAGPGPLRAADLRRVLQQGRGPDQSEDGRGASNSSGGSGWGWVYYAIYGTAILTAFMTAFYTGRAYFMTFWGPEKLPDPSMIEAHHGSDEPEAAHHGGAADDHGHAADHGHGHGDGHDSHFGHESPPVMTIPLVILAVCAVVVGLAFGPTGCSSTTWSRPMACVPFCRSTSSSTEGTRPSTRPTMRRWSSAPWPACSAWP